MSEEGPCTSPRRADFLEGLRVLEVGDGLAGAAGSSILWALGAEVATLVDARAPHRRARPAAPGDAGASLLSLILDRGKRVDRLTGGLEQFEALLEPNGSCPAFDVVVVDRLQGMRGPLAGLADVELYKRFVECHNPSAWVTVSAFGLTGPRAGDTATELTVAAASGMLATVRDHRSGQPLKLAGQQSLLNTGQAAALAVCNAIDLAGGDGRVHLDLSAVEATLAMGPVLEVGGLLLNTGGGGGAKRYGAPASFYACADGLVRISAMEDHQWNGVVSAMGAPSWADDFGAVSARIDAAEVIDARIGAWTATRTKLEVETVLQSNGVPATAVYAPEELLRSPQLMHREALERLPIDGSREALVVGPPFRITSGGNTMAEPGRRRRRSLRGLRMLEASRVLAVPLAGAILGVLGVEVTKLEDLPRLDMYRRRGPYIDGAAGMERSAYFALMNHSKASAAFDVDEDRERLASLVRSADVIIENLGPKRAAALGLSGQVALAEHADLLAVSSSGFGQDGPHAKYRAYAYNLQASCALGYLTAADDGELAEIDIAWADLIAAYALATIVAAWAVGPSGNAGAGIDFAMADLVVAHFNDHLAAASLDVRGDADIDRVNQVAPYSPNGVYPTSDGWVALSIEDDEQYSQLADRLGHESLMAVDFQARAGRVARCDALDHEIAIATAWRAADELVADLSSVGLLAERVLGPEELLESTQLAARGFFVPVEHPEWGRRRLVGLPWRPVDAPALELGPPPRLGVSSSESGVGGPMASAAAVPTEGE